MLQLTQLRMLLQVLETGSFAKAGERLGFSASAVSQQIAALERTSGVNLFERGPRSIRPTAAARNLQSRVSTALIQIDLLEREMRDMSLGKSGPIRIGTFYTAGAHLIPPMLARLRRSHPGLEVTISYDFPRQLVPQLEAGSTDLVVIYEYELVPQPWVTDFVQIPLLRESMILLVNINHPLAGRELVTFAELADERWITASEDTSQSQMLGRLCATAGFAPQIVVRSNDDRVIHGLVGAGLGISLIPALSYTAGAAVCAVALDPEPHRNVFAMHRRASETAALAPVIDALRASAAARARADRWTTLWNR
jgi:DNA-binding transcriptional LysR family regulator